MRLLEWMNFASTFARETGSEVFSFLCKRQKEHNLPCGARKSNQMAKRVTWSTAAGTLSVSSPNPALLSYPPSSLPSWGRWFCLPQAELSGLLPPLIFKWAVAFLWWGLARKLVSPQFSTHSEKYEMCKQGFGRAGTEERLSQRGL